MLRFLITYDDGTSAELNDALTVVFNSDIGVPADDLTLTVPYSQRLCERAESITAMFDDEVVFTGQLDEIVSIKSNDGVISKIIARSPAGVLLDNEAEPLTYFNPAPEFIFNRHLKPFGIKEFCADRLPFYGALKIDKGMTQWQVFQNFCKNCYGTEPRVSGDGTAYFKGVESGEKVIFSEDSIPYHYVKESNKRCCIISEVKLKLNSSSNYSGVVKNSLSKNIIRQRYVNVTTDKTTISTADKIIDKGNTDSYCITLECHGCHLGIIGRSAEIYDDALGNKYGLKIKKIRYTLGKNGENTTVTLGRE